MPDKEQVVLSGRGMLDLCIEALLLFVLEYIAVSWQPVEPAFIYGLEFPSANDWPVQRRAKNHHIFFFFGCCFPKTWPF